MPGFCISCGTPLAAGAKFCEKCGTAVAGQSAPAPPPAPSVRPATPAAAAPAPAAAPPSQGSNTAIKVIFAVLGVFMFLALLAAGSCFYIGYRVRQRAREFSRSMGTNVEPYTGQRAPCAMLSTSEASSALGQPVTSATAYGNSRCEYRFGTTGTQTVSVDYTWQGAAMAMGFARGAMKSVAGLQAVTSVSGIGDEAYIEPGRSTVIMRKGDVMVNIDVRGEGVSVAAVENMARQIADRL